MALLQGDHSAAFEPFECQLKLIEVQMETIVSTSDATARERPFRVQRLCISIRVERPAFFKRNLSYALLIDPSTTTMMQVV